MKHSRTNWLPWGLGAAALGLVFLATREATAAGPSQEGRPAPAGRTARVTASANARSAPTTDAALVAANDAFVGTTVQVIRTGLTGKGAREWWEIVTPGGSRGFAAAIDIDGDQNLVLNP